MDYASTNPLIRIKKVRLLTLAVLESEVLFFSDPCQTARSSFRRANVVAPANALVNLDPTRFSFRAGGLLTAVLGFVLAPWRLISSTQGFIFTWLIGYSALLGPVGGIVITDYFILRRRKLNVDALYTYGPDSEYWYRGGYNTAALAALAVGVLPNVPGFLQAAGVLASIPPVWKTVYNNAWVVGFTTAAVLYYYLMQTRQSKPVFKVASG